MMPIVQIVNTFQSPSDFELTRLEFSWDNNETNPLNLETYLSIYFNGSSKVTCTFPLYSPEKTEREFLNFLMWTYDDVKVNEMAKRYCLQISNFLCMLKNNEECRRLTLLEDGFTFLHTNRRLIANIFYNQLVKWKILNALATAPFKTLTITALTEQCEVTKQTIQKHCKSLNTDNLINYKNNGASLGKSASIIHEIFLINSEFEEYQFNQALEKIYKYFY